MKLSDIQNLDKKHKILLVCAVVGGLLLLAILITVLCMPGIRWLSVPENQLVFEEFVESLGFLGVVLMLLIQFVQIVVAFIPGEVVQVLAGAMYGTWGGLLLCLVGCVIASSAVFVVIRKLGVGAVEKLFGKESVEKYSFLNDSEQLETVVFVLFLIPAFPKDTLTYLVPLTRIKMGMFIALSTIGRVPGLIASTLIGSSIADANWPLIIAVFAVVAVVGLLAIWKRDDVMEKIKGIGRADIQEDEQ